MERQHEQDLVLKKHVATIHSNNKLSLLQRKIANALLFNAYDNLLSKDEHQIHIGTLCNLIGYESNDHKTIKKALVNLLATVIEWNLVDGDKLDSEGIWNASSIIADASIDGPICTYSYSNKMKRLLHRPELYGRLNMLVQAKFKSSYGLALYENCIRFQSIDQTPWFDLIKFRKLMGVEEGKYKIFRDFKHRVIDKAVEEVNQYSPISVIPQFKKTGRVVTAIQFEINPIKTSQEAKKTLPLLLSDILRSKFGLSNKQVEETMSAYEEDYIRKKIILVETSESFQQGKIKHLARYLLSALKDDYQPIKSANAYLAVDTEPEDSVQKTKNNRREQEQVEQYHRYQNAEIIKIYNKRSKSDQKKLLEGFEKFLGKGIYHTIYKRDGLDNILIQDQLCLFLKQNFWDQLKEILSFTDYIAKIAS